MIFERVSGVINNSKVFDTFKVGDEREPSKFKEEARANVTTKTKLNEN